MKIGTDGVLLGSWAACSDCQRGLDIGTGTGLIALMILQRCPSLEMTAIEPNPEAWEEASENFYRSPWKKQLQALQVRLQDFKSSGKFDLIVSNPPFYEEDVRAPETSRSEARQAIHLMPHELSAHVSHLLSETGSFQVILPEQQARKFIIHALDNGLYLRRQLLVRPKSGQPVHRRLMDFQKSGGETELKEMHIRENEGFSKAYMDLTGAYYKSWRG